MPNEVIAFPSKVFFVDMLTRDIDLDDAILDLLDNCVDGIVRQLAKTPKKPEEEFPYDGYWARINASPGSFSIIDNCGGIERDIAMKIAFRLGSIDFERDKDIATVGMYGIGMKRALFKMGRHSEVISRNNGETYRVEISPEWLTDDESWHLDLEDIDNELDYDGTSITISELRSSVMHQFDAEKTNFLDDLKVRISHTFALIMKKGFKVYLNDDEIERQSLDILIPTNFTEDPAIQPFAYQARFNGVDIDLVVGFYRELASDKEIEDERSVKRTRGNAGWTVICNDRVVLHRDKSKTTGWGLGNIPRFHPQFITIAGVVRFSSNNSVELPLNTTKRGLDMDTRVYLHALKFMMDGTKKFTDFTNRWKGREAESAPIFRDLTLKDATEITSDIPRKVWKSVRGGIAGEQRFSPTLPVPPREDLKRRITYYRLKTEIAELAEYFFEDSTVSTSKVGNKCFEDALKRAREAS